MDVNTHAFRISDLTPEGGFDTLRRHVEQGCGSEWSPLRFASVASDGLGFHCEVEATRPEPGEQVIDQPSIFDFRRRSVGRTHGFNAVMLIPTGIDCAIGGHAGDATPAAQVLSRACDHLILHPNVVNASDINEQPDNALYVEGSLICRLMMGTIGLQKVRSNRILMVTEARDDGPWTIDQAINTVSGARATLGIDCDQVVVMGEGLDVRTEFSPSGRATGRIGHLGAVLRELRERAGTYDAVALATRITPHMDPLTLHEQYFHGEGPNPWGGAEAALTHTLSSALGIPTAHAPTMSDLELRTEYYGRVEPRKAAEVVSMTYLFCVLKGLHRAPRVVPSPATSWAPDQLHVEDVSVLVIPDGVIGLPVLAALAQGIPVVAVRGNTNMMRNDLDRLPWRPGQLTYVDNYFEAAGVLLAIRHGVPHSTVVRPMIDTPVHVVEPHTAQPARAVG